MLCAICLTNHTKFDHNTEFSRPSSCMHVFCLKCLLKWTKMSNTCPVCKTPFLALIMTDFNGNDTHGRIFLDKDSCQSWTFVTSQAMAESELRIDEDLTEEEYLMVSTRFRRLIYQRNIYGQMPDRFKTIRMNLMPENLCQRPGLLHRYFNLVK